MAPFRTDDIDLKVAGGARVEGEQIAVGRPTRAARESTQGGQRDRIEPLAVAGPNLRGPRAVGDEGDPLAVRGEVRVIFCACGIDPLLRRAAPGGRAGPGGPPDVGVLLVAYVGQAVALARNRGGNSVLCGCRQCLRCAAAA